MFGKDRKKLEPDQLTSSNDYLDFIYATTNLLSRCYQIKEVKKYKVRNFINSIFYVVDFTSSCISYIGAEIIMEYLLTKNLRETMKEISIDLSIPLITHK